MQELSAGVFEEPSLGLLPPSTVLVMEGDFNKTDIVVQVRSGNSALPERSTCWLQLAAQDRQGAADTTDAALCGVSGAAVKVLQLLASGSLPGGTGVAPNMQSRQLHARSPGCMLTAVAGQVTKPSTIYRALHNQSPKLRGILSETGAPPA